MADAFDIFSFIAFPNSPVSAQSHTCSYCLLLITEEPARQIGNHWQDVGLELGAADDIYRQYILYGFSFFMSSHCTN